MDKKRFKFIRIYPEWVSELHGNNLLVYAYLFHACEISNYSITFLKSNYTTHYAIVPREEICRFLNIDNSTASRCLKFLSENCFIFVSQMDENRNKKEYAIVPFGTCQERREWYCVNAKDSAVHKDRNHTKKEPVYDFDIFKAKSSKDQHSMLQSTTFKGGKEQPIEYESAIFERRNMPHG